MKKIVLALCLFLVLTPLLADERQPLLIPGKTALYQRVLSVPEARLADQPGDAQGVEVTPFSAFYVYERRQQNGREWLLLGTDRHGSLSGWMAARDSIAWNQGLTVEFKDPAGHDRVLMYKDEAALKALAKSGADADYDQLYRQAVQGQLPEDSPVIAIQPAGHIDIRKDFYLVPILDFQDTWLGSEQARMLKIASVPLENPEPQPAAAADDEYTAGLVFVIDASLSMDEYIERTREAVMKIYDQLGDAGQLGKVNFGLVAFRDNARAVPGLDYTAKTWVTLEEGRNPGAFLEKVGQLSAARVSSRDFREDAYAGLQQAISGMNWQGHDARYIVLITDAGAREGNDPLSTTGLSTEDVRQLAQDNGIAIFVLHLKTPATMADHQAAEAQYQELSDFPGIGSLYYGVLTGDVAEFGTVLDSLAGQISAQVAQGVNRPEPDSPVVKNNPRLAELQGKVEKLGYALRMQYLRQHKGGRLPRVFDAWMLDHDIREPARQVVNVRVLLTRDQLSDLHDVLQQVLRTAEEGLLSPQTFLDELKSLAATISRNPEELGRTTATTAGEGNSLVDMGFIGDYIEGLPYTGEVMSLSLDDWQSWPVRRQVDFLRRLEDKIAYYRALHDNTDLWISLDKGPVSGDSVFPLPLDMLP
ncbi:vWA domain-containing protein [Thiolapillus brandeum]|uniref:Serine/threonine-protein kinase PpkA n=1 Tax=Thiolapillus brandeum TaxID=1076588 RepID=A0A7U6GGE5_9GAMM|nr:vWA domain-containing protein [Thiolapillus brandeum]BAO43158.1 serine/threonine-protein kinase PpkA [Thiolapillus brandeum]